MLDGDQALGILKELDQRQEQILKDIDDLNGRIEALLDAFQASRAAKTEPSSVHSLNGLPQETGSLVFTKKAA